MHLSSPFITHLHVYQSHKGDTYSVHFTKTPPRNKSFVGDIGHITTCPFAIFDSFMSRMHILNDSKVDVKNESYQQNGMLIDEDVGKGWRDSGIAMAGHLVILLFPFSDHMIFKFFLKQEILEGNLSLSVSLPIYPFNLIKVNRVSRSVDCSLEALEIRISKQIKNFDLLVRTIHRLGQL